jgi:hypothetical protein
MPFHVSMPELDATTRINLILLGVMALAMIAMIVHTLRSSNYGFDRLRGIIAILTPTTAIVTLGGIIGFINVSSPAAGEPSHAFSAVVASIACIIVGLAGVFYLNHIRPPSCD